MRSARLGKGHEDGRMRGTCSKGTTHSWMLRGQSRRFMIIKRMKGRKEVEGFKCVQRLITRTHKVRELGGKGLQIGCECSKRTTHQACSRGWWVMRRVNRGSRPKKGVFLASWGRSTLKFNIDATRDEKLNMHFFYIYHMIVTIKKPKMMYFCKSWGGSTRVTLFLIIHNYILHVV